MCSSSWRPRKSITSNRLEARYRTLLERDPELESQPTFLFFKGAANGLFAEGAEQLRKPGVDEAEALRIGIRCERSSHSFFKTLRRAVRGVRRQAIFLEFADEEREHLELLIREYRGLVATPSGAPSARPTAAAAARPVDGVIDLHLHTTASDGRSSPEALVREAGRGGRADARRHRSRHRRRRRAAVAADRPPALGVRARHRDHRGGRRPRRPRPRLLDRRPPAGLCRLPHRTAGPPRRARAGDWRGAGPGRCAGGFGAAAGQAGGAAGRRGRPADVARLLVTAGHAGSLQDAFDCWIAEGRPGYVPRSGVAPEAVVAIIHAAGGLASLAHPGVTRRDEYLEAWAAAGLDAIEAYHSDYSPADQERYLERAGALGLLVTGGSDFHGDDDPPSQRDARRAVGGVTLPADAWAALEARRASAGAGR